MSLSTGLRVTKSCWRFCRGKMGTCDDGALRCCRARASRCPPSGQRSFHALSKGGAAPKVHSDLSCRRQFVFAAGIDAFDWGASREAQTRKGSVGPRGATRTEAPHRRGGEGGAFGSGRAGVESQWGLGAGARLPYQEMPRGGAHVVYLIHRIPVISTLRDAPSPGQSRSLIRPRGRSLQR